MEIYEKIIAVYPELENESNLFYNGTITLQDDTDGFGPYIVQWNYSKPLPEGMKVGK